MTGSCKQPSTRQESRVKTDGPINTSELRSQAQAMRLHGLVAHWAELMADAESARRVVQWLGWEQAVRGERSLERRLRAAHIGQFKPMADYDWSWPAQIDRAAIEELMTLQFMADATNVVLVGGNGLGKTMFACNLGYQAVLAGHTVLFVSAGNLLGDLAALDSDSTLRRRLRHYAAPDLLLIDLCAELSDVESRARAGIEAGGLPIPLNITVSYRGALFNDGGQPCSMTSFPEITRGTSSLAVEPNWISLPGGWLTKVTCAIPFGCICSEQWRYSIGPIAFAQDRCSAKWTYKRRSSSTDLMPIYTCALAASSPDSWLPQTVWCARSP
jgi:DNA replication protein DnaC